MMRGKDERPPTCELCGAVSRNAELAQLLRHVISELHLTSTKHKHDVTFTVCQHPLCVRATQLLRIRPR